LGYGVSPSFFYNAGQLNIGAAAGEAFISEMFTNTGTVTVNCGTLALIGGYSLANGTLNFGINSPTKNGQIYLTGAASLAGTISATLKGGYIPNQTNSFAVISYGSETGTFTSTNLPYADAWQVLYGTNTVIVLMIPPITLAGASSSGPGGFEFSFTTTAGQNYTVEYSTDLINWTSLPEFQATGAISTITDTNASTSQRFYRVVSP
jgi:hypothetical protein